MLMSTRKKFVTIYTYKIYNKEIEKWSSDEDATCSMQDVSSELQLINSAFLSLGLVF
jgi:hypothetical protein